MNITKRLMEIDPTLVLHNEGFWDRPFDPNMSGYTSFNDAGVETETGEFLYAMARILKPDLVLETGTHIGVGAAYLGMALKDNNKGVLDTIEFIPELRDKAIGHLQKLGLHPQRVISHLMDVAKFTPVRKYQLIFLDTEPQTRFAEFVKFYDWLDTGGYLFIHDMPRSMCQGNINTDWPLMKSWPFGDIPAIIKEWENQKKIKPFHFGTPRGLIGFYKPHKDDYVW